MKIIWYEKPGNSLPFRGTVLEDVPKVAVNVDSICTAIRDGKDCNTVCSMLRQMKPAELSWNQGRFLIQAVEKNRYDLLTAMVRELNFSVDCPSTEGYERSALFVSAIQKNREMSKFLIQELKADVNKTLFSPTSKAPRSVLTRLVEYREFEELKFFLVSVL